MLSTFVNEAIQEVADWKMKQRFFSVGPMYWQNEHYSELNGVREKLFFYKFAIKLFIK